MMEIAFRTDASLQIGTGHVMRCLTLADALVKRGAKSTFICRPHDGHLMDLVRQRGHTVFALAPPDETFTAAAVPAHAQWLGTDWDSDVKQTLQAMGNQTVDWLVVDHYALDHLWEQRLRTCARRILVIDDLADRPHECDLLLDQNLGRKAADYNQLISSDTPTLIGPSYALLRPEFAQWRTHSLQRRTNQQLKNLLITMGGVDQTNTTGKVLEGLRNCDLPKDLKVTVVMGATAPWLAEVQTQAASMHFPTQVLVNVNNMAQLMAESDLCIGAVGSTAWERCSLGLPCIQLVLADNQKEAAVALAESGAAVWINGTAHFTQEFQHLIDGLDTKLMKSLTERSAGICTGNGSENVITQIIQSSAHNRSLLQ